MTETTPDREFANQCQMELMPLFQDYAKGVKPAMVYGDALMVLERHLKLAYERGRKDGESYARP